MCALEQGREVKAVPGNVLSGRTRGGHALIRDGAKIVESADDIVRELQALPSWSQTDQLESSDVVSTVCLDPCGSLMEAGRVYGIDELAHASGLTAPNLLRQLTEWELRGLVRRVASGGFIRTS